MNKLFNFLPLLALRAVVVLGFVLGVVVRDSEVMVGSGSGSAQQRSDRSSKVAQQHQV